METRSQQMPVPELLAYSVAVLAMTIVTYTHREGRERERDKPAGL